MINKILTKRELSAWLLFALFSVVMCFLLSLRPIPSDDANNDTGRYVQEFDNVCKGIISDVSQNSISWQAFDLISQPACFTESNIVFLFLTSIAVPLSFLLFSIWRRENLLLAIGFLLSTFNFELMTNAFRQGASLFFLIGAFSNLSRKWKLALTLIAVFLHDSSIVFLPLLLVQFFVEENFSWSKFRYKKSFISLVSITCLLFLFFDNFYISRVYDFFQLISEKYAEPPTIYFLIFMMLPIIWNYLVRYFFSKNYIGRFEKIAFVYIMILLLSVIVFMPFIVYRFTLSALVIQIFIIMQQAKISSRSSVLIFLGFIIHMGIFSLVAPNVKAVLFG